MAPLRRAMARKHRQRRRSSGLLPRLITWGGLSLLAHLVIVAVGGPIFEALEPDVTEPLPPMTIVMLEMEEPEEPEEEEPEVDWDGQLVDTPKPNEEIRPEEADYLAEYNNTVEEETMSERFRINPEVLSNVYSEEDKVEYEDLVDVNAEDPSTGAQIGNERFAPDRHGALATLPSPFQVTNKDGFEKPTVASHSKTTLAGAPNNDLLKEKRGVATNLNTKEFLYASYMNHIRRLVNFYWSQNLDNLPGGLPFSKPSYETVVSVTITEDGRVESIEVNKTAELDPLDQAVVQAWWSAGPFPPPPEGLLEADGRAYLPNASFTVTLGQGESRYMGVDPRQNVQFPGIMKSPR